ncbi:MAG TPA: hypothetical protein VMV89_07305 [Candidatus Paceibacterota bacterium]|nr:hypothetical protein [Candidatus Paceibacterota bacterium]
MTTKTRNWLLVLCIVALPFLTFSGFIASDFFAPPPLPTLPNPNGYDDFVKAGQMVASNTSDFDKMNEQELQMLVNGNSNSLQLVRSGLQMQCRVALDYSPNSSTLLDQLAGMKRLAQAFAAEGKLAEMENRPNDAAKSYLDAIHFGNESVRGGVLINELVGVAIEAIATSHLANLVHQLDAKSCRESATTLEALDSQRQTWNEFMQQENDWSRRTFPGVRNEIARLMTRKSLLPAQAAANRKLKQQQTRTRQLIIDLAARAYELDKGTPPASLADLVPDYLKAIPQDPSTGTNMVYLPR